MSRYNVLMQNRFEGCMIIGLGKDEHRNRHIVLYALPGDFEHVGVHDGVDSWIASAVTNPFGLDAAKTLREIEHNGAVFEIEFGQTFRRFADGTYVKEAGAPPGSTNRSRRRLGGAEPATPLPMARTRHRIGVDAEAEAQRVDQIRHETRTRHEAAQSKERRRVL